ncbi:P-loop NTPase family protein [Caldinitratiruptor microaerophilus]|uniref:hypothetical protein n=1 Tax=Caldinitratiruptor microaerophilus TaxID=671077 RepID=UPI0029F53A11|nr:hypothetical protein [Caldinitratiruptor microaerophilus]
MTSLSLALALPAQIQLRGWYPLELETVIGVLERLQFENMPIGRTGHVPELRARPRRGVLVDPAQPGGRGSRVRLEMA